MPGKRGPVNGQPVVGTRFSAEKSQEGHPQGLGDDPPNAPDDEQRAAAEYHQLDRDEGR